MKKILSALVLLAVISSAYAIKVDEVEFLKDGTKMSTAASGGGGAGASYSEDFTPSDFDVVTNLTITHNLGEKVIAQIFDASSNQFFTGLQLVDDNVVFDMHLFHSTTGFVVVAAGTNTVNFSEFLTSGNVSTNDMDATADAAYRGGGGSGFPLTEGADFDGYGASNVISLVWSTNSTAVAMQNSKLVQYVQGGRMYYVLNSVTNYLSF